MRVAQRGLRVVGLDGWRRTICVAVIGLVGLGLPACSSGHRRASAPTGPPVAPTVSSTIPPVPSTTSSTELAVAPAVWTPCAGGLQCATVTVPLDYTHPDGATLAIAVAKLPAASSAAGPQTLLFNPGGPASSGIQELKLASVLFPPFLHQNFTIVSFDPRGTGSSARLNCGTNAAEVTSAPLLGSGPGAALPVVALYAAMVERCAAKFADLTPEITTMNTARDMDRIREALGLATINYLGVSYGTLLGEAYAQLFPGHVRTMILDGGVDATRPLTQDVADQAAAAQKAFQTELASCAHGASCPLGPTPLTTYEAIARQLSAHPASAGASGGPPVTEGDLASALLLHLTVPGLFNFGSFATAALNAEHGNGAALRSMALNLWTDIDGTSLVDPYWALTCNDNPDRPSAASEADLARTMEASNPGTGAFAVAYDLAGCSSWPPAHDPVIGSPARGAPPILVIGGTGDPNTPYMWSEGLARSLGPTVGVLLTRVGVGHSAFLNGASDTCIRDIEIAYVTNRIVPAPGTVCNDPTPTG
jgi:pimeloyl-ACP methyl ester carboxylesterase